MRSGRRRASAVEAQVSAAVEHLEKRTSSSTSGANLRHRRSPLPDHRVPHSMPRRTTARDGQRTPHLVGADMGAQRCSLPCTLPRSTHSTLRPRSGSRQRAARLPHQFGEAWPAIRRTLQPCRAGRSRGEISSILRTSTHDGLVIRFPLFYTGRGRRGQSDPPRDAGSRRRRRRARATPRLVHRLVATHRDSRRACSRR